MANPNLNSPASVYVNNALVDLTSTSETQVVSNAASSGRAFIIDSIVVSNYDGTAACDCTVTVYNAATNSGTGYTVASTVSVPADSTLVVVDKNQGLCLKEGQSIYVAASAANDLKVVACWKEYA
jgi:hypothetical protein